MERVGKSLIRLNPREASMVSGGVPVPSEATLAAERPQETWLVEEPHTGVAACCSLWWRDTPRLGRRRVGYIGHYAASRRGAARTLLRHAAQRLAARGCQLAIAPVDGSTWQNYRFVIDGGSRAPFFLEPQNPRQWVDDLTAAGFAPRATYRSAITEHLDHEPPRLGEIEGRLRADGVTLRPLDPARLDHELRRIHALALTCFKNNFLYTTISKQAFLVDYMKIMKAVRPDHVRLAERDGALCGFVFAVPDHAQARRGETVDTLILKTVAVRPDRACAGLGRVLIHEVNRMAARDGYRKVIHALMHESNASLAYSRRIASPLRRYAVFARGLA